MDVESARYCSLGYWGVWMTEIRVGGRTQRSLGGACLRLMSLRGRVEDLDLDVGGSRSLEVPGVGTAAAEPARSR